MTFRSRLSIMSALAVGALLTVVACSPAGQDHTTMAASPTAVSTTGTTAPTTARSTTATPSSLPPITVLAPSTPSTRTSLSTPTPTQTTPTTETSTETTTGTTTPTVVETTAATTATSSPLGTFDGPAGTVVVIDPGHNGQNAKHPEIINKQVPAGFGQTKACNTTGTATNSGFPEHALNWKVAVALQDLLQERGITVVLTRTSDDGVGPCVNERAKIGNDAGAAAVISIHGDGETPAASGFFVMTASRPPAGPAVAAETEKLAAAIRDGMVDDGFHVSNRLGKNGLWARGDLAGLNLSLRPTVMIELGNMRNADEAKMMSSPEGQQQYARGLARGILAYLGS